jgi:septum formation protein
MPSPQLILASASPRRSQLLDQIGIRHQVLVSDIDESPLANEAPDAYVMRLAAEKSAACQQQHQPTLPILAADTTVVCDGHILGKPLDQAHAMAMLMQLSNRSHQVYSAISLRGQHHQQALSINQVHFKALSASEISAYWQTGEPCDKAGGYAIQGLGSVFVASISGSFSGVMGLPLFETAQLLAQEGIEVLP